MTPDTLAAIHDLRDGRFRPRKVQPADPRQLELFENLPMIPWHPSEALVSESWRGSARAQRLAQPTQEATAEDALKLAA